MSTVTKHLIIHGRVQGVCYRAWMVERAGKYDIRGWVRNRREGTVEALIHGDASCVDRLIQECHDGPDAARVTHINADDAEFDGSSGFSQTSTI